MPPTSVDHVDVEPRRGPLARLASCVAHEATATDLRNIRVYLTWMLAWALISFTQADWFGGEVGETSAATLGIGALKVVAVVGVALAFARFVRESDELNRAVHLRGIAFGFATGFLAAMIGESAQQAGLIGVVDVDIIAALMLVAYGVATVLLMARYR